MPHLLFLLHDTILIFFMVCLYYLVLFSVMPHTLLYCLLTIQACFSSFLLINCFSSFFTAYYLYCFCPSWISLRQLIVCHLHHCIVCMRKCTWFTTTPCFLFLLCICYDIQLLINSSHMRNYGISLSLWCYVVLASGFGHHPLTAARETLVSRCQVLQRMNNVCNW
jgi:hypothetical protein